MKLLWFSTLLPALVTFTFVVSGLAAEGASDPCLGQRCTSPLVKTVSNGYTYSYDSRSRTFQGVEQFGVAGGAGKSFEVVQQIDCGFAAPPDGGGGGGGGPVDCARAICRVGARIGRWIVVWVRETAPVAAAGWTNGGRHCAVATDPIPLRAVDAAAEENLRRIVAPAVPVVQPGAVTLVNFPTIVSTRDPGRLGFAITEPLPGAVVVAPVFAWVFTDPDGSTGTGSGAGTPFDGTPPGSRGHYLTHRFTGPGTGTITVTETWTGTVTVPGVAPVALDPLVYTRAVGLAVRENQPVLVGR